MLYYDKSKLLGHNKLFNFVLGARGIGKTYSMKSWAIRDYIRNGRRCWWVMRYHTELDKAIKGGRFFADVLDDFKGIAFKIDGKTGYLTQDNGEHWEPFINFQALSDSAIKAISDPECNKIIFDEFIPLPGIRYLSNEVERFLEFYFTISRGRDVRAVFLANNVTAASPYFTYFNITPGPDEFTVSNEIVIQNARTVEFRERMKNTRFGKLVSGSHYEQYAIDNESFADNPAFISERMPERARDLFCIKTKYGLFRVLACRPKSLYIQKRKAPIAGGVTYAVDVSLHDSETVAISIHYRMVQNILISYYSQGLCIFDSIQTKAEFMQSCSDLIFKK